MGALTPKFSEKMSNVGQVVVLPDGRRYRFLWSGMISEAKESILMKRRKEVMTCHHCAHRFPDEEPYYNRRSATANKKSRFYCLGCAKTLGYIEEEGV